MYPQLRVMLVTENHSIADEDNYIICMAEPLT